MVGRLTGQHASCTMGTNECIRESHRAMPAPLCEVQCGGLESRTSEEQQNGGIVHPWAGVTSYPAQARTFLCACTKPKDWQFCQNTFF